MLVVPTSRIILLKNPIEIDYNHELTFTNKEAQYNYFYNLPKIECEKATYVRKDNIIRFPTDPNMVGVTYDDLIQYNYCMYQNDKWSDKWFYAFVKSVTFDNPGMSYIEIETDVWQSWMFDITFKNSFIEREHVNDDTIGANTVPENLDTGEFVINDIQTFDEFASDTWVVVGVSKLPEEIYNDVLSSSQMPTHLYNGIYSGLYYVVFKTYDDATKFLLIMDGQGIADNVYSLFMIPHSIVTIYSNQWSTKTCTGKITIPNVSFEFDISFDIDYKILPNSAVAQNMSINNIVTINNTLNGYTPKNNKMKTGEFNYMYVTNNNGQDVKYNYEDFYNNTPKFNVVGSITPGCSIRLVPQNYKLYNQSNNEVNMCNPYGLTGGKYPVCSWSSDSYTNWLTQQSVNIATEQLGTALSTGILAATGNPMAVFGIMGAINDSLALKQKRDFMPVQAKGNINSGDVTFSMGWGQFVLFKMSCRYEFAKRIDEHLSAYGYKVQSIKLPNITGRTNWNYVKTIGCNLIGDIPQGDLEKIKNMFNNGVTLWHNPSTFLDYSQNNTIVT